LYSSKKQTNNNLPPHKHQDILIALTLQIGAPDLIVEIISPSTTSRDKVSKFDKYMWAGVREYWIADPADNTMSVNILKGGEYVLKTYAASETDTIPVQTLHGCQVNLRKVFCL